MSKIYGIVYKATNKIDGKVYIGQTIQSLSSRRNRHIADILRLDTYFSRALKKYGKENFIWEVLTECNSLKELNKTEIEMIEKYNTFESGYNLTKGGEGRVGCKHTEESKKKMSEATKGENNGMYGKRHSKKTKEKMSESRKGERSFWYGRHLTEESKRKQSESMKGEKNPNYNKKFSIETRQKMSKATKGKYIGEKNPKSKKYIVTTPKGEEIFVHGIIDFCRNYKKEKLDYTNLVKVAREKLKQYKGYKCKYWEEKSYG